MVCFSFFYMLDITSCWFLANGFFLGPSWERSEAPEEADDIERSYAFEKDFLSPGGSCLAWEVSLGSLFCFCFLDFKTWPEESLECR